MSDRRTPIDHSEAANRDLLCKWLNLPKSPWPPDYYTLVGLARGQGTTEEIEHRILERMEKLRQHQLMQPVAVTRGMNLLAQAMNCLTHPDTRLEYDRTLSIQKGLRQPKDASHTAPSKPSQQNRANKPASPSVTSPLPIEKIYSLDDADPLPPRHLADDHGTDSGFRRRQSGRWKIPVLAGGIVGLLGVVVVGIVLALHNGDSKSVPSMSNPKEPAKVVRKERPKEDKNEQKGLKNEQKEVIWNPLPGEERVFDVGNGVKMTFCWIPPSNGKVTLGSSKKEQDFVTKTFYKGTTPSWLVMEKEHEIEGLDGFWMAKTEMTQEQYVKITMKKNPSGFRKDAPGTDKVLANTDEFPVENVSWEDAKSCIEKMHLPQELKGWRIALPSEAQWEYACRGGEGNDYPFYWGDELTENRANCNWSHPLGAWVGRGEYLNRTTKVGSYEEKEKHPWGLVDMVGNVVEWCEDYYGPYEKLPKNPNPVQTQKQIGELRTSHGGAWAFQPPNCRSAYRFAEPPNSRKFYLGFRVVVLP